MKDGEDIILALTIVTALCLFGIGFAVGNGKGEKWTKEEAIKNNCAEWVADKDGSAQFKWKTLNNNN